jgi:hypothetical protein
LIIPHSFFASRIPARNVVGSVPMPAQSRPEAIVEQNWSVYERGGARRLSNHYRFHPRPEVRHRTFGRFRIARRAISFGAAFGESPPECERCNQPVKPFDLNVFG